MSKKLSIELSIRLQEQLLELVQTYGAENVKEVLDRFPDQTENKSVSKVKPIAQKDYRPSVPAEPQQHQSNLPPNVKSIGEFEKVISEFAGKAKIKPEIFNGIQGFIQNAKLIMSGEYKKVNEGFIINLTSKGDLIQVFSPEEDWIKYNAEIIRTQLKRKLRLDGYDFLDSEVEVGKLFDDQRHNCVGREPVSNPALDKRVLKVMNEGLIIDKKLHINANVVIGVYKSY